MSYDDDSDYNYRAFSFAMDDVGIGRWLREGPKPGQAAPEFSLKTLDGSVVSLTDLRGQPVVLEFGSYTCPIFCGQIKAMEAITHRHPEAAFLVVYTREAHPGDVTPEHRSPEDKSAAARRLLTEESITRTVLVDDVEGTVHRAYGGAWDAAYVIDASGTVVLRQAWTHPDEVEQVLTELAAGRPVAARETTDMAPPSDRPMGEGLLRGGKRALFDFYRTAPPPVQQRLLVSPSAAVRAALLELTEG